MNNANQIFRCARKHKQILWNLASILLSGFASISDHSPKSNHHNVKHERIARPILVSTRMHTKIQSITVNIGFPRCDTATTPPHRTLHPQTQTLASQGSRLMGLTTQSSECVCVCVLHLTNIHFTTPKRMICI